MICYIPVAKDIFNREIFTMLQSKFLNIAVHLTCSYNFKLANLKNKLSSREVLFQKGNLFFTKFLPLEIVILSPLTSRFQLIFSDIMVIYHLRNLVEHHFPFEPGYVTNYLCLCKNKNVVKQNNLHLHNWLEKLISL